MPLFFSLLILYISQVHDRSQVPTIAEFFTRFLKPGDLHSVTLEEYLKSCGIDLTIFAKELDNPSLIADEISKLNGLNLPFHRTVFILDKLFQIAKPGTHAHMLYLLAVLYTDSPTTTLLTNHKLTSTRVAKYLNIKLSHEDVEVISALAVGTILPTGDGLSITFPDGKEILYQPHIMTIGKEKGIPQTINAPNGTNFPKADLLSQHCNNLTELARKGKISKIIGRQSELKMVIETLLRKKKNCPILIGEPGTGKTAIAEGLAVKIANNDVPPALRDLNIYSLDITSLVAGTTYRGQLETRITELITKIRTTPHSMLFIDEMHMLMNSNDPVNIGNMLKPALSSGEFPCMGATTYEEYRKYIESDGAMSRRFSPVHVKEPTPAETLEILQGLAATYEDHHNVKYAEGVLEKIVALSHKYLTSLKFPDKAVDILDTSGVKARLSPAVDTSAMAAARELVEKFAKDKSVSAATQVLSTALDQIQTSQQTARITVTPEHVYLAIAQKANIPYAVIISNDDSHKELSRIQRALETNVVGQEEAVAQIMKNLRKRVFNLTPDTRPQGSFLFAGSTGVGKTLIAQVLAKELYHRADSYVKLDMSEYMEKASVARLIGAPPGYIGHENAGQLSEKLRRNPYSLILVDEIDKAHPDVLNIFLQILEDGKFTDSHGVEINCNHATFIFTTNAGAEQFKEKPTVGFVTQTTEHTKEDVRKILTGYFRPEFLNRLDTIVAFKSFSEEHLKQILQLELAKLQARITPERCKITLTKSAIDVLLEMSDFKNCGAREIRRLIEQKIADIAANAIIQGLRNISISKSDIAS